MKRTTKIKRSYLKNMFVVTLLIQDEMNRMEKLFGTTVFILQCQTESKVRETANLSGCVV